VLSSRIQSIFVDKSQIKKGDFITAGDCPVEQGPLCHKNLIVKGTVMHGGDCPVLRKPKPVSLQEISAVKRAQTVASIV
jgi:hypothetical protein